MSFAATMSQPLVSAGHDVRTAYLRRVSLLTLAGLVVAGFTGFVSAGLIALVPALQSTVGMMVLMFGSYGIAHFLAPSLVFREGPIKWVGFAGASVFQGIAMGYLLLAAMATSMASFGSAFLLVGQALMLTVLTAAGMVVYLWTGPRQLSFVKAAVSMLFLPMLLLMVLSFAFPIGGALGIGLSALFVLVSAGGLLVRVNAVLHELRSDMHVEGAYMITMGILVLFWNLLTLLMRLNRR